MSTAIHNPPIEPLIDAAEASVLLKIPKRTVLRLVKNGEIPGKKIGKVWRFWPSVLHEWLQSGMRSGRIA